MFLNGQLAAQSVREANAYLLRVLGMDQRAFLASVCAQQKELTAFATMLPSDWRRLVLDLLGVSPVERPWPRCASRPATPARPPAGPGPACSTWPSWRWPRTRPEAERQRAEEAERAAAAAEAEAAAALAAAEEATAAADQAAKTLEELVTKAGLARAGAEDIGPRPNATRPGRARPTRLGPEIEAATARVAELAGRRLRPGGPGAGPRAGGRPGQPGHRPGGGRGRQRPASGPWQGRGGRRRRRAGRRPGRGRAGPVRPGRAAGRRPGPPRRS